MKIEQVTLQRKAVCRYTESLSGYHDIPRFEQAVKLGHIYVAGNFVNIFICKEHAEEMYGALTNTLAESPAR